MGAIIPDDQMPQDSAGRPFEVLLNPLGIISRGNPAQLLEAALGKIAAITGKPYKVPSFGNVEDLTEWVQGELQKHGLTSAEEIFDPNENRKIPGVDTGNRFIMKLHHTAEAKLQGRATGGYSSEDTPAKGGPEGSKRVGMLETNALLSHGAYSTVQDASVVRGQRNEDYWRQVMSGYAPPNPRIPNVYHKFIAQLRAAGIHPIKQGTKLNVYALGGRDVDELVGNRELQNVETVHWKTDNLAPKKGGLFDPTLTGGHGGNRWASIKLHEPVVNPVMEEPVRRILGLTEKQYRDVLAGHGELQGRFAPAPGDRDTTGPKALVNALQAINLDREIAQAHAEIAGSRKTYRDAAIRRLGYLKAAKAHDQHPSDWIWDKVPVLPPAFRAVSILGSSGVPLVADPNFLYKEVFDANQGLKDMQGQVDDVGDERLALYDAIKGVTGLGDPITPKNKETKVRGILKHVFGGSPKHGVMQRRLLGSTVDLVGRATITPNPDLDMDQVGLPKEKAWTLYQPFIVRRLVRRGMPKMHAMQQVKDRTPAAMQELLAEMKHRPLIVTRAPVLHRYGVMAFWPQLAQSDTLEIPPLVTGGFGADFDGDAAQMHVVATDAAVEEAKEKLLPSRNLLSAGSFGVHYIPTQEFIGGLWAASTRINTKRPVRVFNTTQDAIRAYRRGEIDLDQRVEIGNA